MIIELLDLFSNLWRYINNNVPLLAILKVALLYAPKCIFYALPVSVLFSVSYTLGLFYSRNELIAVFGSGVSIYRFTLPFILCGFFLSIFTFYFHEKIVINTFSRKNELTSELLRTKTTFSNNNITVMNSSRTIIYNADFYNDSTKTLTSLMIIDRTINIKNPSRIDCKWASWDDENNHWLLTDCRKYTYDPVLNDYKLENISMIEDKKYNLPPQTFRRIVRNIDEMDYKQAAEWIKTLKSAGLPHKIQLAEYYKRFSFPFTCLVVSIIASSIGGNLRKNILLMSLLSSLLLSVFYYIMQMVLMLFAKIGYLPPFAGAWGTFVFFIFVSIAMFRYAKT
jgi:lipopolysaccharide export system permease protein